jgi:TonB family protein
MIGTLKILMITVFALVFQDQPTFKGGNGALDSFIQNRMIYPNYAKNNCLEGTINVSFNVNKLGEVTNATVAKGLGIDLDQEAVRIIRLTSGNWEVPENFNENDKLIVPINFSLKNFGCNDRSIDQINQAIVNYQARVALEKVVVNYYRNKEKGTVNVENEFEILQLKSELGFDGDFINSKLKEARQKLRQGDQIGACETLFFIKYIGSAAANLMIAEHCK